MVNYLKIQCDLTITFDGGKVQKPKSFYTVHVTTTERQTFLFKLDDALMLSHTAHYIWELLESVILDIRPFQFSGSSSDDMGNTKNSHRDLLAKRPYILNLQDACHLLSLCSKQICQLPELKEMISYGSRFNSSMMLLYSQISDHLRKVLSFMDKSGYAMEHFNYQHNMLKIGHGLEKISKTQFANIHWSAASLQCGLPAMQAIISDSNLGIDIKGLNHFFKENTTDSLMFQVDLAKLIAVTGPYTKAIQCLELAQTTCADVYLYWLAIVTQMEQLIQGNTIRLCKETKTAIHAITNAQFKQMINDAPNDPYITAFFSNPEYRAAQIYKNINPLNLPPIQLSKSNGTYAVVSPKDAIIKRVGMSLQCMLKHEYGDVYDGSLKVKLKEYCKGADPFNRKPCKNKNVQDWWLAVQKDENVQALMIKLYSVVPVPMADKRTVSTIMWLNSPTQSRQDITTLKETIQIHQWHHWKPDSAASKTAPSVKWCDMHATILGDQQPEKPMVIPPPARPPMKRDITMNDSDDETSKGKWPDDGDNVSLDGEESDRFDVGDHINLSSGFLLDVLSDQPVQLEPTAPMSHGASSKLVADAMTSSVALMDDEWEIWESAE
ncbi:uncharacterized protein BJ212DRAFT_1294907 [Suillus subaureus]|uniref:DUF659 domain-containing protein n=1 Tax=Suillus subaureus TaxID=48587 RepID=A0A9P7JJ38_9AGAM|nr:uncharacterized protein BJ212DRAFT_1294907 [Suillus subaureus]KAG1825476.1 hypothetical protein BJ212DRAFT_1294907 [Suillus subaureus]